MEVDPILREYIADEYGEATAAPSKRLALVVVIGLFAMFTLSVLLKPPDGEYFTICGFKNFTGLPCPGCGLTHSFCALGKGDVLNAFAFNLLGPFLFVGFVLAWIRSVCVLLNRSDVVQLFDRTSQRLNLIKTTAIAFAVYGAARIIYLLAFGPVSLHDSPLSQLIARIIR